MPRNPNKKHCQTPGSRSWVKRDHNHSSSFHTLLLVTRFLNQLIPYVADNASVYGDLLSPEKLRVSRAKIAVINPADPNRNRATLGSLPTLSSLYIAKRFPEKFFTRKTITGVGIANA